MNQIPWPENTRVFMKKIGITRPIIQAPMAGGPTTAELIAAVSNAGGLGSLGAGYLSPEALDVAIADIRSRTSNPFSVNLMVPEKTAPVQSPNPRVEAKLKEYAVELGISAPQQPNAPGFTFRDQLAVVLEHRVPVFSFTFGIPQVEEIAELKGHGIAVVGSATSVLEGTLLHQAGCDAVVAQGIEAGGHRGSFAQPERLPQVSTLALIPQLTDSVPIPIIASGGIMDGRGIVAALVLGAAAVQMGTAFLSCSESGAPACWKKALLNSQDTDTVLTKAFSGKYARGIRNAFSEDFEDLSELLSPYPQHNGYTKSIRAAAKEQARTDYMSLWAGQAAGLSRSLPAADLVEVLCREVGEVLDGFGSRD